MFLTWARARGAASSSISTARSFARTVRIVRRLHPVMRVWLLSFAALALLVSVAGGGTLPHLHDDGGWWNEEHDLVLLATASPSLVPVAPSVVTTPVVTAAWTSVVVTVSHLSVRSRDARAPPAA